MDRDFDEREEALTKRAAQERLLIGKLSREDLEDKYIKNYDENILLKKHCRKQEEKIKKMATKLIRLVNDRKKSGSAPVQIKKVLSARDVETEDFISELQQKLADSDAQNKRLREKIQLQSLQSPKKPNATGIYDGVNARIDTGLPKRMATNNKNIRTISTNYAHGHMQQHVPQHQIDYGQLYAEKQELEEDIQRYQSQVIDYEQQIESLRLKLKNSELNYEEDLLKLKNQVSQDHKHSLQENIDQIRLQRELKEKSNQCTELLQKFNSVQQQYIQLKETHDNLLGEIDRYHQQLKQEQQKTLSLKTEIKNMSHNQREILELKECIEDLHRDNEILKDSNEKLLNSAFSLEREREFREKEKALKIQIAQLEATLKSDVGEKGTILDKLTSERNSYDKLNTEFREMQIKYYDMKQKYDDMNDKLQFLNQEGNFDYKEVEEALIIVKEKKNKKRVDFVGEFEEGKGKLLQKKIAQMEAELAETVRELEKQRQMLIAQIKINENYKREVSLLQNKMEENKSEYDNKMLEQAQLLDIKQANIKKLERQLKDIAYGTKQVRVGAEIPLDTLDEIVDDKQLIANLERGQNIFEIHITRLALSEEGLKLMKELEPSTFCTIEFFEHELQTTPIIKGTKPEYDFTSQYIVKIDDFFLHYLQKETTTIELHQAFGSDYKTVAACQLSFRSIIDSNIPRLNGTARLISVDDRNVGVTFATIEYWARLILPVDQAFRLYKERTKALGYLSTNTKAITEQAQSTKKQHAVDNMNELHINVLRCSRINSKVKGKQPAAYCVYRFFDFKDHDTEIITASNYPEFNDHKSYPIQMDIDLDRYLRKEYLCIYLFDDNQPENDPDYLGLTRIPLIALAHDKDLKGTFELLKADGKPNGTIDVNIYWKYSYEAPPIAILSNKTNQTQKSVPSTKPDSKQPPTIQNDVHNILINGIQNNHHHPHHDNGSVSPRKLSASSTISGKNHVQPQPISVILPPQHKSGSSKASSRASSVASKSDAANSTIRKNEIIAGSTHYNDTYFGDREDPNAVSNDWQNLPEIHNSPKNDIKDNEEEEDEPSHNSQIENWLQTGEDENMNTISNRESRDTMRSTNDDEDVISSARASIDANNKADKVVIEIESFALNSQSEALKRDDIQELFVSLNFSHYGALDSEPIAKPRKPNQTVRFDFKNEFLVDMKNNLDDRTRLARALVDDKAAIITFFVVSEPAEQDEECEEIAFCCVDMKHILKMKENIIGQKLELIDCKSNTEIVGHMIVTVEILDVLLALQNEYETN